MPFEHAIEPVEARVDALLADLQGVLEAPLREQVDLGLQGRLVRGDHLAELLVRRAAEGRESLELGVHRDPARAHRASDLSGGAASRHGLPLEAALLVRQRAQPLEAELLAPRGVRLLAELHDAGERRRT